MNVWHHIIAFVDSIPLWVFGLLTVCFYAISADRFIHGTYTPMTFAGDVVWAVLMWRIWRGEPR